jgi:serine/threonine protein kinase
MEYVDGLEIFFFFFYRILLFIYLFIYSSGSLSKHLSKFGPFSEASIRNYTRQLLEGVQYLHENHILHRDIKSANILVNSRG